MLKSVLFTGLLERGIKATVTKGHETLVLYCNLLNFIFNSLTLSKTRRKESCRKERLECVLPKIRIDAFT